MSDAMTDQTQCTAPVWIAGSYYSYPCTRDATGASCIQSGPAF